MQTLLAHALDQPADRCREGLARLERHYQRLAGAPLRHEGLDVGGVGLHLWEASAEHRRWPAWQQQRGLSVATLHAPVGYERLVGDLEPGHAAVPLARELAARPQGLLHLGCPFVVASLDDAGELTLLTDAVGLARLYQARVPRGWVWSNRPAAALLFAGLPARPDAAGWRYQAGTDSYMADSSPFHGVARVRAATRIQVEGRTGRRVVTQVDALGWWLSGSPSEDPLEPDAVDEVAQELQQVARSAGRLWHGTPELGLSGGRDSRVVVAAFLAAGVDVRLHTNDNPVGEADVARELVRRWPRELEHDIRFPPSAAIASTRTPLGAVDRALRWMRYSDALQPASYLPRTPPASHARVARLTVSGIGGEVGHGGYHPPDVAAVEAMPEPERFDAYLERLTHRLVARGADPAVRAAVAERTRHVLRGAAVAGADGVGIVDGFYVTERLPSFSAPSVTADTLVPLLSPRFVRAALRQSPEQRRGAALHRAVVAHLIPAWQDVPYFADLPPVRGSSPAARPPSIWQVDAQREVVAAVLDDTAAWADAFDVALVHRMWRRAVAGEAGAAEHAVLQRVVWRAVFADYLAELNGRPVEPRAPLAVAGVGVRDGATAPRSAGGVGRGRLRRNAVLRRAARSRAGRWVRGAD